MYTKCWALVGEPGFLDCQIFDSRVCFLQNHFGQYSGERSRKKRIKVFWRDPGQNGGFWGPFLIHWDSNLPSNVEKWTFWFHVRPNPAKVREKSFVCSVRSSRTPLDLLNFNLNYQKTTFCVKLWFSMFTNRSLVKSLEIWKLQIPMLSFCVPRCDLFAIRISIDRSGPDLDQIGVGMGPHGRGPLG